MCASVARICVFGHLLADRAAAELSGARAEASRLRLDALEGTEHERE
jgi:hypothetical protein